MKFFILFRKLDNEIKKVQIDYWVSMDILILAQDYYIGKMRIIIIQEDMLVEDTQYNPWHLMELD